MTMTTTTKMMMIIYNEPSKQIQIVLMLAGGIDDAGTSKLIATFITIMMTIHRDQNHNEHAKKKNTYCQTFSEKHEALGSIKQMNRPFLRSFPSIVSFNAGIPCLKRCHGRRRWRIMRCEAPHLREKLITGRRITRRQNHPFSNNTSHRIYLVPLEKLIGNKGNDGNSKKMTEKTNHMPLGMDNFLFPLLLTWRKSRKIQKSKGEFQ